MHPSTSASIALAALLVLTGLVRSETHIYMRQLEFFDTALIQNLDETKRGPENTLSLINGLCIQPPNEDGKIAAAIN
jgi:hypothetical protein